MLEEALREMWEDRMPFNDVIGLKIESFGPPSPRTSFAMRPALVGHFGHGQLHGGVTAAVLDATGGFSIMCAIAEKNIGDSAEQVINRFARMGTIDLRIDFLHRGLGRFFVATSTVIRLGGRIANTQMALHNDEGTLIATGSGAYMVS